MHVVPNSDNGQRYIYHTLPVLSEPIAYGYRQKAIDAIRKMPDEDVELILGFIERVRKID